MNISYYIKSTIYRLIIAISPKLLLKLQVRRIAGYWPNLDNPKTFNEKIQWYKLYYHHPLLTCCADKYEMRKYLEEKGLGKYQNKVYGVWDNANKINFDKLPEKFVLKSTHGTAQTIVCNNKSNLDFKKVRKEISFWLKTNQCGAGYEWAYKNIKPRIICEELIETEDGLPPKDYKFLCFNGEPKLLFVASERYNNHNVKFDFFDIEWNHLPFTQGHPNSEKILAKPEELQEILGICRIISKDFPHVRIDFYIENHKIMIGELTFYHFDGFVRFNPSKFDKIIGSYFTLPNKYA